MDGFVKGGVNMKLPANLTPAQKLYIIQQQAMFRMRGINPERLKNVIFEMAKRVRG
jgi:hypothetical protein